MTVNDSPKAAPLRYAAPQHRRASRFVLVFTVLAVGLLAACRHAEDSAAHRRYLAVVAQHSAWLLGLVGHSAEMEETARGPRVRFVLREGDAPDAAGSGTEDARAALGFDFLVVPECGATELMALYVAGVVAFPAGIGVRLLGLAAGIPALYAVNLLRLVCLALVGAVDGGGAWFEFCHRYVWQSVYKIFVAVAWLAWVEFLVRRRVG